MSACVYVHIYVQFLTKFCFFKKGSNWESFLAGNILFQIRHFIAPLNLLKSKQTYSITATLTVLFDPATLEVYGCPKNLY